MKSYIKSFLTTVLLTVGVFVSTSNAATQALTINSSGTVVNTNNSITFTSNVTAGKFIGDGSLLINLPSSTPANVLTNGSPLNLTNATGTLPAASLPGNVVTNGGPASLSGINNAGTNFVITLPSGNQNIPGSVGGWIQWLASWNTNVQNASIWYNEGHFGVGEWQAAADGSIAIVPGAGNNQKSVLQLGGWGPSHDIFYLGPDGNGTRQAWESVANWPDSNAPSHLLAFYCNETTTNGSNLSQGVGMRAEDLGNGQSKLVVYNPLTWVPRQTNTTVLPGVPQAEYLTNGFQVDGAFIRPINAVTASTNVVVAFTNQVDVLTLSGGTKFTTTNYVVGSKKEIFITSDAVNDYAVTFPTNWVWLTSTPAAMTNNLLYKLTLECFGNSDASIYASAVSGQITITYDTNALNFFAAAAVSDLPTKKAINQFVRLAKQHGYWTNLIAIWPLVGTTSASEAVNLVNTNTTYALTFSGGCTYANGVTFDGTNGIADSHVTQSGSFISQSNSMFFGWVGSPATNAQQNQIFGSWDSTAFYGLVYDSPAGLTYIQGPSSSGSNTRAINAGDMRGFAAMWQTNRASVNAYEGGVADTGNPMTTTWTAAATQSIRFATGAITGTYGKFQLYFGGAGQNFTAPQMTALIADLTALKNALGRP